MLRWYHRVLPAQNENQEKVFFQLEAWDILDGDVTPAKGRRLPQGEQAQSGAGILQNSGLGELTNDAGGLGDVLNRLGEQNNMIPAQ